jgi:hypothetical protein
VRLDLNNNFPADPLHLTATQALIVVLRNSTKVSGKLLELQTGTSGVEYKDVHVLSLRKPIVTYRFPAGCTTVRGHLGN